MANKTISGARILVHVDGVLIGTFHSVSWNSVIDIAPVFVLGRFSAAELNNVAYEPISGSLTGWAVVDHGPHTYGLPALQDLLTAGYITLTIVDRLTGKTVGTIYDVRLGGKGKGFNARQLAETTVPFQGLREADETVTNSEAADSADLP